MMTAPITTLLAFPLAGLLALVNGTHTSVLAQEDRTHTSTTQHHGTTGARRAQTSVFVKTVREATERFHDVAAAEAEGYALISDASADPIPGRWGCTT